MSISIQRKVELCAKGEYPFAIAKMNSGWLCLAETQPLPGYCILFSDPIVSDTNALSYEGRSQWGLDCAKAGDALIKILGAVRVNYETWGNLDPVLHTHITPRFRDEPAERRTLPPRQAYDVSQPVTDLSSAKVQKLMADLKRELTS
jgi:diadenosine tetraphosphate (Ap4A) HIT family hydrolase